MVKHSSSSDNASQPKPTSWRQPSIYDPQSLHDLRNLRTLCAQTNPTWVNPARSLSDSVFELYHPNQIHHPTASEEWYAQSGLQDLTDLQGYIDRMLHTTVEAQPSTHHTSAAPSDPNQTVSPGENDTIADQQQRSQQLGNPSTGRYNPRFTKPTWAIPTRLVYLPWTNELIHYPADKLYHQLRTFRYRDLITADELAKLRNVRLAVIGQSVGGNLAFSLIQNGIGNAILLCDQKGPTISNFGRANMTMTDLGASKVHATAKRISIIDPYVQQTHLYEGLSSGNIKELARFAPDIIVDEVDDMRTSAYLRVLARRLRKPYISVSDVHDNAVLEICRHDLEPRTRLYASKLPDSTARDLILGKLDAHQQEQIFIKSIGIRQLTPRMIRSGLAIGETLAGIPQLGTTASASAALATVAIRNIVLGVGPATGMYATHLGQGSAKPSTVEWAKALFQFWMYSRNG